jgi:phosphohistidine phosphatase
MSSSAEIERPHTLLLLRHAKSNWDNPGLADFDRPLSERGRQSAAALSSHLAAGSVRPDVVLCSPAQRTRETLEGLGEEIAEAAVRFEPEIYEGGLEELLDLLRQLPEDAGIVMAIGHNPTMHVAALMLAEPDESDAYGRLEAKFPTCALATLAVPQWPALAQRCGVLTSFWTPR